MSFKLNSSKLFRILIFFIGIVVAIIGINGINQRFDPIKNRSYEGESFNNFKSLYLLHFDQDSKQEFQSILIKLIHKSNEESRYNLLSFFSEIEKNNRFLNDYFLEILKSEKHNSLIEISLNYLSNKNHPWLKNNLVKFIDSSDQNIQLQAISLIPKVCPKNIFNKLEKIKKDTKNENLKRYIEKIKMRLGNC